MQHGGVLSSAWMTACAMCSVTGSGRRCSACWPALLVTRTRFDAHSSTAASPVLLPAFGHSCRRQDSCRAATACAQWQQLAAVPRVAKQRQMQAVRQLTPSSSGTGRRQLRTQTVAGPASLCCQQVLLLGSRAGRASSCRAQCCLVFKHGLGCWPLMARHTRPQSCLHASR